jgi:Holliday junction resolvase RusA-like endonuclease
VAELHIFVPGKPRAKGSSRWIRSASTGKAIPPANDKAALALADWEAKVAHEARREFEELFGKAEPLWNVSVNLNVQFVFVRPKSHYKSNDRTKPLRACAPDHPRTEADRDKLLRAVQDALTGVVYTDDKLVCAGPVSKIYADAPGADLWLTRME